MQLKLGSQIIVSLEARCVEGVVLCFARLGQFRPYISPDLSRSSCWFFSFSHRGTDILLYLNLSHFVGLETRRLGVQSNQALKIEMLISCVSWLFGQTISNCFRRKCVKDAIPFPSSFPVPSSSESRCQLWKSVFTACFKNLVHRWSAFLVA